MSKVTSEIVEEIPTDKHVFVCGMTGSGKSVLAETYLTGYDYVVKLDTKNETDERMKKGESAWKNLEEGKDFTICRTLEELEEVETDKIIYVPDYFEQNEETFDAFFQWIFERENTVLWIDELLSVATSSRIPKQLLRLYTQGRSKNVGVWSCTQRPNGSPRMATANASYFFVFDLTQRADRKRLVEDTGMSEMLEMPKGHNFWYYKMGDKRAVKAVLKF